MKVAIAGGGAFGTRHAEAIQNIAGVEVISAAGGRPAGVEEFAAKWSILHVASSFEEMLALPGLEAVIIASPTQIHAQQAEQCMRAGKHVLIEIPITDSTADAERLVAVQKETGVVAMAGHVRRFNPSHQWVHNRIQQGELKIQQMDVQTYFFRRTNMNALGQPRSWTDHLLWHHACHTVDLFMHQTGEQPIIEHAIQGPIHPDLGIAMDMSIQLKVPSGSILTLSLSFNNEGPFGSFFRYICDHGTYKALYDDLVDGNDKPIDVSKVDVSLNGVELEDREFFAAIAEKRSPKSSLADVLPTMQCLGRLEEQLS
ncbi:MAG TPA: Gfo/Idh/MocA family oxidoreductase [Chloroflexota bacterium]|jgi:2-hydroxy-4-carboxymuconate semialdehyde hemiacetal dehydrogenase